jgi:hypothetical protein
LNDHNIVIRLRKDYCFLKKTSSGLIFGRAE